MWAGQPQPMVLPDSSAKGLRTILKERGINTTTLKADDTRMILANHKDFVTFSFFHISEICKSHFVALFLFYFMVILV